MNKLNLNQLIQICFLPEDVKKDAITKLPSMTDDQKMELEQICWENLRDWFELELQSEQERMITQMALDDADYKPQDFEVVKDKVLTELLTKISEVKTNDELALVKQQLKEKLSSSATPAPLAAPAQGNLAKAVN